MTHNDGPYSQPSDGLANTTWLTAWDDDDEGDAYGTCGAVMRVQFFPASTDVNRAVQGPWAQGEVPSRKPVVVEGKLTEPGSKFAGTGAAVALDAMPADAMPKTTVPPSKTVAHMFLIIFMPHITTVRSRRFRGVSAVEHS